MFGKGKKIISQAYKEKLLAEIAHYEKRIDEALHKRSQTFFEEESSDEDSNVTNPYKLNIRQSGLKLRQQEASLSNRLSLTLELAMLTIMQSEVNVMVTPPEVRRPVQEDGVWLEVVAECKIDLVSFTITFYAHKPHRRFAPVRYRNVTVNLVKPAHEKELAQSVLPKLNRPNLALQVLQSYATAFRSRRTTLLELAEKYEDKLRMGAMPEGGYRVRFLSVLQVEWTLENLWSPVVPFCHRMKFELEYMPNDYIQAIGNLYKQFKDPSLETSERTSVLARIFDTCLQAQGLAREIQESFESDPESAGRLHERRTTIDQEPDVPNVEHSPHKPKGKENKAQNRKTAMEPPKTIPKKAKKVGAKKSKDKETVVDDRRGVKRGIETEKNNDASESEKVPESCKGVKDIENDSNNVSKITNEKDIAEIRKSVKFDDISSANKKSTGKENKGVKSGIDNAKKLSSKNEMVENRKSAKSGVEDESTNTANKKANAEDVTDNRKGLKRGIESDATTKTAKKSKTDQGNVNSKSKPGLKGGKDGIEDGETETVISKKAQKKVSDKNVKEIDIVSTLSAENYAMKKGNDKCVKSTNESDKTQGTKNMKKGNKENEKSIDKYTEESNTNSKKISKGTAKNNEMDVANSKNKIPENNATSKNYAEKIQKTKTVASKMTNANKDDGNVVDAKHGTKKAGDSKNTTSKDDNTVRGVAVLRNNTSKGVEAQTVASSEDRSSRTDHTDTARSGKTVVPNEALAKVKTSIIKDKNIDDVLSKKVAKNKTKEANVDGKIRKTSEVPEKNKQDVSKHAALKDTNTVNPKEVIKQVINKKIVDNEMMKNHNNKETGKISEKVKGFIENNVKTTNNNKIKETARSLTEKNNVLNPKTAGQKFHHDKNSKTAVERTSKGKVTDRNNELLDKKSINNAPDSKLSKNKNDDKQIKKSTADKKENNKNVNPKLSQNGNNILKEKTNRNETTQKVAKHKTNVKNATFTKGDEKDKNLNVTVTKSKNMPVTKLSTETQVKLADKLKTKIPMVKSNFKLSTISGKLLPNNMGRISRISSVEKTKIPQKSLPVFKKVVKNLPTRISPRKLPSTFKPSSRGLSNK